MPWLKVKGCPDYQDVNWIHPLFQRKVFEAIEYTKTHWKDVTHLIVFGSVARGDCTESSDIDFCVVGDKLKKFYLPVTFNTPYDTVWLHDLDGDSSLLEQIAKDGVVVYGSVPA